MTIAAKLLQQPDGTITLVMSGLQIEQAAPVEPVPEPTPEPVDPLPPVDPVPDPEPVPDPTPDPEPDPTPEPAPEDPPGDPAAEPEPVPAVPAPAGYAAFLAFDEDAVTFDHFNKVGNLWWSNRGGDWIDATGTKQGDAPVSSAPVTVAAYPKWVALDVTAFAERWMADVNDGLFLRSVGGQANYHTRDHADASLRPYLSINTDEGQWMCDCIGDVSLSSTTAQSLGSRDITQFGAGLLRFDLTGVTGEVLFATAYLYTAKQYGNHQLNAFFVDAPVPFDVGAPVIRGLAAAYQNDEGIEAHPDVLASWDWAPGWSSNPILSTVHKDEEFESVLIDGRHWLKVEMPVDSTCSGKGEGTGLSVQCPLGVVPASIDPAPLVATYPEDVYFRYSLMLDENWTSVDDRQMVGGKFPGLAGRYGYPVARGAGHYWQVTGGNGGIPGKGKYIPASTWIPRPHFMGWSARSQWAANAQGQHDNPMRNCTGIGGYLYHPKWTEEGTGNVHMWRNAMLVPGRKYDIEIRVKMNSVVGPFDEHGNGTAVEDGVYETWIDGVLTHSDHAFVWRIHPYLGVEHAWYLFKNGGTLSPCRPHTVYAGPAVVSRTYIGPRNRG